MPAYGSSGVRGGRGWCGSGLCDMSGAMCYRYNTCPLLFLCCLLAVHFWPSALAHGASPLDSPDAAGLEEMLREHAAKRAQVPKPALAPPSAPVRAPVAARPPGKPPWVEGADPAYPVTSYLCAVGAATEREAATNAAYGNLAKTFVVQVKTSSEDALAHRQATGHADQTVQALQLHNQLTSNASLQGVSIYETWEAPNGQVYAWACLDRGRAADALREQIAAADAKALAMLEQAAADDKATRLRALAQALDAASARGVLVGQLRWVDAAYAPMAAKADAIAIAARLAQTLRELRIGIWTEGAANTACRTALVQTIAARGYHAAAVTQREQLADFDMVVVANTEVEHAGSTRVGLIDMQLARGMLQVEIRRGSAVLLAYEATQKAGSQNVADAHRRVLRGLAGQVTQDFGPKIDAAVRGTLPQVDL